VTEDNFRIVDAPIGEPGAGEVLVKNEWLSLDPYMRGRMNDVKSYVPPVQIGEHIGQTERFVASGSARSAQGAGVRWQLTASRRADEVTRIDTTGARHRTTSACSACRG
jgi:NADPH-dependent curcumin reductase CurA